MLIYKISKFSDVDGFLKNVATVLGKSKKGVLDITAAARAVIQHWNNGMKGPSNLVLKDSWDFYSFQMFRLYKLQGTTARARIGITKEIFSSL